MNYMNLHIQEAERISGRITSKETHTEALYYLTIRQRENLESSQGKATRHTQVILTKMNS